MPNFNIEKYKNDILKEMRASNDSGIVDLSKEIAQNNYFVFPGFVDVHVHCSVSNMMKCVTLILLRANYWFAPFGLSVCSDLSRGNIRPFNQ